MPNSTSKRPNSKIQTRYSIYFYCESIDFIEKIYKPLFTKLFGIAPYTVIYKNNRASELYNSKIESIVIYNYLKGLGMKTGKKSKIACVPKMPKKFHVYFLAGLLDTDGGKKGCGFGLSTASQELSNFCQNIFKSLGLSYHSCPWQYNGHIYHQIYAHKKSAAKLLGSIPFRNKEKIFILKKYASLAHSGRALSLNKVRHTLVR